MNESERWLAHDAMSDPGRHIGALTGIQGEVNSLICAVQGMLVHADWAREYGIDERALDAGARQTLSVENRLDNILARNSGPFTARRPVEKREFGTCRDFSLLMCSMLRARGVPARVRCGFAAYFGDGWKDHWVCERWDEAASAWRLCDAQLDTFFVKTYGIGFDPADVPRSSFVTAGDAWQNCRNGMSNPDAHGHGDTTGLWFVRVNVVRDHFVLNGRLTSNWDRWREAVSRGLEVSEEALGQTDALASQPEQPLVELRPHWLS